MRRLKRESDPPTGQLACPEPQAWDLAISDFSTVTGQNLGGGRFGADGVQWGKTASGLFVPIRVDAEGRLEVQLSGNIPTLWGASIDDRPAASSVQVGQIFVIANENLDMWVSNGISWVVI